MIWDVIKVVGFGTLGLACALGVVAIMAVLRNGDHGAFDDDKPAPTFKDQPGRHIVARYMQDGEEVIEFEPRPPGKLWPTP